MVMNRNETIWHVLYVLMRLEASCDDWELGLRILKRMGLTEETARQELNSECEQQAA